MIQIGSVVVVKRNPGMKHLPINLVQIEKSKTPKNSPKISKSQIIQKRLIPSLEPDISTQTVRKLISTQGSMDEIQDFSSDDDR
eukprot:UN02611